MKNPIKRAKWLRYQLGRKNNYYLITLPHSGTHWVRFIVVKALVDYFDLDYKIDSIRPKKIVPHFGNTEERFKYNQRTDIPRVQQCHLSYFFWFSNKKVILLVRDLRDTLVSHYEFLNKTYEDELSFEKFLKNKGVTDEHVLKDRVQFLNSWHQNREKLSDLLLLKYEKLKENTEREVRRILEFLEMGNYNQKLINNIIQKTSLDNMKKLEKKESKDSSARKINKGKSGRYSQYFKEEEYRYFKSYLEENLIANFGYKYEQT